MVIYLKTEHINGSRPDSECRRMSSDPVFEIPFQFERFSEWLSKVSNSLDTGDRLVSGNRLAGWQLGGRILPPHFERVAVSPAHLEYDE